jgi:hypothetical protein
VLLQEVQEILRRPSNMRDHRKREVPPLYEPKASASSSLPFPPFVNITYPRNDCSTESDEKRSEGLKNGVNDWRIDIAVSIPNIVAEF